MQFIILCVEWRHEMDSLLFFWDSLDGVSNLEENANGNKEDMNDHEEQCQPPAEGDLGDQLVVKQFFWEIKFQFLLQISHFFQFRMIDRVAYYIIL